MAWIRSYAPDEVEEIRAHAGTVEASERDPYARPSRVPDAPDDVLDAVLDHARMNLRGLTYDERRRLRARWDGDEVLVYVPEERASLAG